MKKTVAGILSIGAPLMFISSIILSLYFLANESTMEETGTMLTLAIVYLLFIIISVITTLVLMVVYIIHAAKNKKVGWAVCLYMFNIFVIPFYWYHYIYKAQ